MTDTAVSAKPVWKRSHSHNNQILDKKAALSHISETAAVLAGLPSLVVITAAQKPQSLLMVTTTFSTGISATLTKT
jgi:hypothetical protein